MHHPDAQSASASHAASNPAAPTGRQIPTSTPGAVASPRGAQT